MPCRDYLYEQESESQRFEEIQEKVNSLTAMLCSIMRHCTETHIELVGNFGMKSKDAAILYRWWEEHQKVDEKRLENARKSALAKLTPDEKEALGIEDE